jgi:hypothetical protein
VFVQGGTAADGAAIEPAFVHAGFEYEIAQQTRPKSAIGYDAAHHRTPEPSYLIRHIG